MFLQLPLRTTNYNDDLRSHKRMRYEGIENHLICVLKGR